MALTLPLKSDIDILNYALTLEHLEATFYVQVVASNTLIGDEQKTFTVIRDHEIAHVDALTKAITAAGGAPEKAYQSYKFGDLSSRTNILNLADTFEPTGVKAYDGVAAQIQNKDYLAVAGQIVQIEARHAATVHEILVPDNPVPMAFAETLTPQQVLDLVAPFLGTPPA